MDRHDFRSDSSEIGAEHARAPILRSTRVTFGTFVGVSFSDPVGVPKSLTPAWRSTGRERRFAW
jgi:hypothetical protein